MEDITKRLLNLSLTSHSRVTENTLLKGNPGGRPPVDAEIKSILKEVSKRNFKTDTVVQEDISKIITNFLRSSKDVNGTSNNEAEKNFNGAAPPDSVHEPVSRELIFLKALVETYCSNSPKSQEYRSIADKAAVDSNVDLFWNGIISRNLAGIYDFFDTTFFFDCNRRFIETSTNGPLSSEDDGTSSTTGRFAHHQLLGHIQKGIRVLLMYLKRQFVNMEICNSSPDAEAISKSLDDIAGTLCGFLSLSVDLGLDIRCNIGLALSYILYIQWKGNKELLFGFFKKIFESTGKEVQDMKQDSVLKNRILEISETDVNRIALTFGVLGSLDFEDISVDYSQLMFLIGRNILDIDHGTREAVNLGSARVLETWTDKLSYPCVPQKTLDSVTSLFPPLEFFIFNYMPGHIDAVKNCCRNTLNYLVKIYDRIDKIRNGGGSSPAPENLIEELLKKILTKPSHVRWFGLACVAKNSELSVKVLKLRDEIPTRLLCAQRAFKSAANETYISLMSYEFPNLPLQVWEDRWLLPLFWNQSCQNNTPNWPQKKAVISTILNSERNQKGSALSLQPMISPLIKFVVAKMNSKPTVDDGTPESQEGITESALLAAETIKIASELGLKVEVDSTLPSENSFRGLVPRSVLHSWLWSENPQIRLAGFSLLADTKKSSEIITKEDFESLKIVLKYNLVSQNPAFRQQFMSYFKKLLKRLKDSQALLKRKRESDSLCHYDAFFLWLWKFFTEEEGLFVGANFGRRCQSLECLAEMVIYFDNISIFGVQADEENTKYLRWLTDSYENNKIRALEVLEKMPLPAFEDDAKCDAVFEEALALCESVRPPDSVTGRYLMMLLMKKATLMGNTKYSAVNILSALLQKLEETYAKIEATSLTEVSSHTPMYGVVRCIRMILSTSDDYLKNPQAYKDYSTKLIDIFVKYDNVVFPVLGNAAPEGFLPGLPDSSNDNKQVVRSIAAQMLLVCSWRTMRDICLTLADMVAIFPIEGEKPHSKKNPSGIHILTCVQVSAIGDHMLHLMRNLMHRGVFEQVYVGFKVLATRLWQSSNPSLSCLPEKWLKEAMDEEHMNSKCITRRSAGLPFIFQALLSAECDNEPFLSKWVQRLFISDDTPEHSPLRVHAMNVLRGLFKDANFSKAIMPFVPDGMRIAFMGLKSRNWTERNSGLMLYGAVMKRTFGPKLNLMSAPTFFRRFPQMYEFLLGELDMCLSKLDKRVTENSIVNEENASLGPSDYTYHLLLLLSSFAPVGRVEDEHFRLSEFIPKLLKCATSPDMEVRKVASKAMLSFLISFDDKIRVIYDIINELKDRAETKVSRNWLHGCFFQIATIVSQISEDARTNEVVEALANHLTSTLLSVWEVNCPTVYESVAEILLAFNNFSNPNVVKIYHLLENAYVKFFGNRSTQQRNNIPGLLVADCRLSRAKISFNLSVPDNGTGDENKVCEIIYTWLSSPESSIIFVEQLLWHLCENPALIHQVFNSNFETEGAVLLDCLVRRYLTEEIKYMGQSVYESKLLEILTRISEKTYNSWLSGDETDPTLLPNFIKRVLTICVEDASTTEHKHSALRIFAKLAFETDSSISMDQQDTLCTMLANWSDSTMDDDLRHAVALSFPQIPFPNLTKFSVINQAKIWLAALKLAQDDDLHVRLNLNSRLSSVKSQKVACDRKSLEALIEIYFKHMLDPYPLEGLTILVGLMLRDDFEIKAEEADDDEDGRLFDKSEMNTYCEPVILALIVSQYLSTVEPQLKKRYKELFEQCLSIDVVDLYELASNYKLYVCNSSLKTIIDIVKQREEADQNDNEESSEASHLRPVLCTPAVSEKNGVQYYIRGVVEKSFLGL